ncbi:hypothetical protein scyTo_0021429, partial [Scyliorhinus torazame]|nr:hypothetical protein [Scyliorhinus torazame]
ACETGFPHDGTFIVLGLVAAIEAVIIVIQWRKSIIHYYYKAIQALSKETNGVVNQQPVQEQGSADYLPVSGEESSIGTGHNFANCKQTNGLTLNEKDGKYSAFPV